MTKVIQNYQLFNGINQSKPIFFADIREKNKFEQCHFREARNIDAETCSDENKFLEQIIHLLEFNQLMIIIVIDSSICEIVINEIIKHIEQWKAAAAEFKADFIDENNENNDQRTKIRKQWGKIISIEYVNFDSFYSEYPSCSSLYMGSDFPNMTLKTPPKLYPTAIISQFLYLGNYYDATDTVILKDLGITHVIDATNEELSRQHVQSTMQLEYLSIPIWDMEDVNITEHFENVINFINHAKYQNKENKILVHCRAGISRSATFLIAYLMHSGIVTNLKDALTLVVSERPYILPNISFRLQLMKYETMLYNISSFHHDKDDELLAHISSMNYCWSGIFSLETDHDKIPIIAMGQKLNSIKLADMFPSEHEKNQNMQIPKKTFLKRNTGKITSIYEKQRSSSNNQNTTMNNTTATANKPLSIREFLRAQRKQEQNQPSNTSWNCHTEIDVAVKEK